MTPLSSYAKTMPPQPTKASQMPSCRTFKSHTQISMSQVLQKFFIFFQSLYRSSSSETSGKVLEARLLCPYTRMTPFSEVSFRLSFRAGKIIILERDVDGGWSVEIFPTIAERIHALAQMASYFLSIMLEPILE